MYQPKPPGKVSKVEKHLSKRGTCHDEAVNARLDKCLDTVQSADLAGMKCSDTLHRYTHALVIALHLASVQALDHKNGMHPVASSTG
jgi:hypothetical protein